MTEYEYCMAEQEQAEAEAAFFRTLYDIADLIKKCGVRETLDELTRISPEVRNYLKELQK